VLFVNFAFATAEAPPLAFVTVMLVALFALLETLSVLVACIGCLYWLLDWLLVLAALLLVYWQLVLANGCQCCH
jgi:hypothetical protein